LTSRQIPQQSLRPRRAELLGLAAAAQAHASVQLAVVERAEDAVNSLAVVTSRKSRPGSSPRCGRSARDEQVAGRQMHDDAVLEGGCSPADVHGHRRRRVELQQPVANRAGVDGEGRSLESIRRSRCGVQRPKNATACRRR
jgi:hypothetical protein